MTAMPSFWQEIQCKRSPFFFPRERVPRDLSPVALLPLREINEDDFLFLIDFPSPGDIFALDGPTPWDDNNFPQVCLSISSPCEFPPQWNIHWIGFSSLLDGQSLAYDAIFDASHSDVDRESFSDLLRHLLSLRSLFSGGPFRAGTGSTLRGLDHRVRSAPIISL